MNSDSRYVIVIAGPTAIGKTDLAIRLAAHFGTEIISADSRQCYQEMEIGTAKPTPEERQQIPHHFIDSFSVKEAINAFDFEQLASGYLDEIFRKTNTAIVCGGTGLYIKALLEGLDEMPASSKDIEKELQEAFAENGIEWLQQLAMKEDPDFCTTGEMQNQTRIIRALAFKISTGKSITRFRTGRQKKRNFIPVKIALDLPRPVLYDRINKRVDTMLHHGLVDEAARLYPLRALKNLQTVGYSEFYQFGEWPLSPEQLQLATEQVKQHTRNYAKRQLTWFRKDKEFHWFAPTEYENILAFIMEQMSPAFGRK